jgi:hypothetical protein
MTRIARCSADVTDVPLTYVTVGLAAHQNTISDSRVIEEPRCEVVVIELKLNRGNIINRSDRIILSRQCQ